MSGFFSAGTRCLCANDSRIDQQIFQITVTGKVIEKFVEATEFRPTVEAFENRVPFAVAFGSQSPLRAGTSNREHGIEKAAAIALRDGFREMILAPAEFSAIDRQLT